MVNVVVSAVSSYGSGLATGVIDITNTVSTTIFVRPRCMSGVQTYGTINLQGYCIVPVTIRPTIANVVQ